MGTSPQGKDVFDFTKDEILLWGGSRLVTEATIQYIQRGEVTNAVYSDGIGEADIFHAGHSLHTRFRTFKDRRGLVENLCPCAASQRDGRVCVHMVAAALALEADHASAKSGAGSAFADEIQSKKSRLELLRAHVVDGSPSARAMASGRPVSSADSASRPRLRFYVPDNWVSRCTAGYDVPVAFAVAVAGRVTPCTLADLLAKKVDYLCTPEDDHILYMLEHMFSGDDLPMRSRRNIPLSSARFVTFLKAVSDNGLQFHPVGGNAVTVRQDAQSLPSVLHVTSDVTTGQLELALDLRLPDAPPGTRPQYLVFRDLTDWTKDVVYALYEDSLWPLRQVIPATYGEVYFQDVYRLPRKSTIDFIRKELRGEIPMTGTMKTLRDILGDDGFDVQFDQSVYTIKPWKPKFFIEVSGSRASLALKLNAVYSDFPGYSGTEAAPRFVIDAVGSSSVEDFTVPDQSDNFIYYCRNRDSERAAVMRLAEHGIVRVNASADASNPYSSGYSMPKIIGDADVLNFLASTVPLLHRRKWSVSLDENTAKYAASLRVVSPLVDISVAPDGASFEIGYRLVSNDGSIELSEKEVAKAEAGVTYVEHNGGMVLFDRASTDELDDVIGECLGAVHRKTAVRKVAQYAQRHRLPMAYAHYIKATLDSLATGGVRVLNPPAAWLAEADCSTRVKFLGPAPLNEPVKSMLRPYQTIGVAWLRDLETKGQAGILADEMGLGKTIQTLAWLSLPRVNGDKSPALVICPTSLVFNWLHEANHFVPEMKAIAISGAQRHEDFAKIPEHRLVITSYALIRRDIEEYRKHHFSAIVLDEAQNTKNQNTMNARSVKMLNQDACRLVVTGTPIENSVSDIWSIFDFLLPGYLGHYETFKRLYEEPMQAPIESEMYADASWRIHERLAPFLLRRLKTLVAKDLPPKIVRTSWCELSPEQRDVYDRILEASRNEVTDSVHEFGFEKSRMLILTVLLRLRQVCCHLSLLDSGRGRPRKYDAPSSKLEQLNELLRTSIGEGHRVLIFSQFVQMLHILRREFERTGVRFCYLDGTTKDRMTEVSRFNSDPSIPVFLISLKAGGSGLNLTGADEVIHFDPWWNPAVEDQATDRAHRIGQKNTVYSIRLITSGTVEERVLQMQRRKRAIIDSTVEGDDKTMAKLTWADVKKLLDIE